MNSVITEVPLKQMITEAQEIIDSGNSVDQTKVQHFLAMVANSVDHTTVQRQSAEFAQAVQIMREHSFISIESSPYYSQPGTPGVETWGQASIIQSQKFADSLGWPPVLPQIAVIMNLVRMIVMNCKGINYNHDTSVNFDFSPFSDYFTKRPRSKRNGWSAFYLVFGDLVRVA